jgi:hypothetical protein
MVRLLKPLLASGIMPHFALGLFTIQPRVFMTQEAGVRLGVRQVFKKLIGMMNFGQEL